MNNRDPCNQKEKKLMDTNILWQWRVMQGTNFSRHPEPFCCSNKVGLNFNVSSNTQKKMDLQLVTNGVILEVCDFANTVNKSKSHFITQILENNFDLGLENEQQRIDFTARILHKVKDLIRKPPKDKHEVFTLFDTSFKPEFNSMDMECKTECFLNETDDSEHEEELKCLQATSKENTKTESLSEEMYRAHGDGSKHGDELKCSGVIQSTEQKEDVLPPSFPYCEEIGLNLDVGSKQNLDPHLLTMGVMLEIVQFTRVLTASYSSIVLGVLEHNFELQLKSQWAKNQIWLKISDLLKRRKRLTNTGSKITPEFKNETFSFQTNPFTRPQGSALSNVGASQYQFKEGLCQSDLKTKQEKRALLTTNERFTKRLRMGQSTNMEIDEHTHHNDLCTNGKAEGGDCDLDSDIVTNSGHAGNQDHLGNPIPRESSSLGMNETATTLHCEVADSGNVCNRDHIQNPTTSDIPSESHLSCLGICAPFLTTTDISSTLPTVNSNVNQPFASPNYKRGLCGGEEPTQAPIYPSNECDMEQEGMGTEDNMWKLRANRVKQFLSSQNKELGPFNWSKKAGLEFNVGFGPKQNISVDSLNNHVLLEVAKFARAMNSSQQYFIMEILEYNFDFDLQSQYHGNTFTREIMNGARQLSSCEGAVKYSNEVFELPGPVPSVHMASQSVGRVNPDLNSVLTMEERDVAPICPPDSHSETKHALQKSEDLYPFCKEIGLKLHVNNSQPNKKLEINKLTNGAMTEVTNFAEKLCGTFEQICVDILRHNLDLDLQSGDSDLARSILAQMPALMEQKTPSTCVKGYKEIEGTIEDFSTMAKLDCQTNNPNVDACSAGPSQAPIIAQNVGSSLDTEHQNELNLKLWKLRANHIEQILSVPHLEHCPLYSYSGCKNLGIDFNVGAGVKQNLDPKLLTNGIMAEINTFVTALYSATKHFITEILEYNFNLNLKNELDRSAFAQKTMNSIHRFHAHKKRSRCQMKKPFELPDMRCIAEPTYDNNTTYCLKCYQDRNDKLCQDESDLGHIHHPRPHTMTSTVSADANCTAQKPAKDLSSTFSTIEEEIMEGYPHCKKIGLNLCVDKAHPKDKLDTHVLTHNIMYEVYHFAVELCGRKIKNMEAVLEHNFNMCVQCQDGINCGLLYKLTGALKYRNPAWLSNAFVIQPCSHKQPGHVSKLKKATTMQKGEWMEAIKKRKLALQTKVDTTTLPSRSISDVKSKTKHQSKGNYPICMEIGLDLDVTSKSAKKKKLNLKVLTRAVVMEIHKFAIQKVRHFYPRTVYDILDYNFNLSSQYYRRWEFLIATSLEVKTMVKQYLKKRDKPDKIFKLPFVFDHRGLKRFAEKRGEKPTDSTLGIASKSELVSQSCNVPFLTSTDVSTCFPTVTPNMVPLFGVPPNKRGICEGEEQTEPPRNAPNKCDMEEEEMGIKYNYTCHLGESDLDADEVSDSGNSGNQDHLQNSAGSDIPREPESSCLLSFEPFITTTDISSTLPTVNSNVNPSFASQPAKKGLCGSEEQIQAPIYSPNECDIEQEGIGTEDNIWKLRANRVKQILSSQNKELGPFNWSKKAGLEFNVGFGPKQNIIVDSLNNHLLLELAKFARAMNSSQQYFIMEILEYNFDFDLQSQHHGNTFTREIMNGARQLSSCEDAVKYSNEVFELPGPVPSVNMASQSVGRVNPDLNSVLTMEKRDDAPICPPDSHSETKHALQKSEDLYPFCKEIGLKLHVNNSQPNKKLEINKLTNGAMTEVTNFAEKLCGTFEQICVDILRHNLDLDLQSGDSDLARSILAQMPALMEQKTPSTCVKGYKEIEGTIEDFSTMAKLDCQTNNPNVDACSAGPSQAPIIAQNVGSSLDTEHQNELNLKLWKLRANHIEQILSVPHLEHCPLYSYSGCKNLGIDFNVGAGVKQNLDPKLLTNGIMAEINTFVTALYSATKHFITEILEYNFNLNLKNELDRSAFAQKTMNSIHRFHAHKKRSRCQMKKPFELPDMRCIAEPTYDNNTTYCLKCYQDRNDKLCQDESDLGHIHHPRPHTMTSTVSADANCTAQKPAKDLSSTFSTIEEEIMEGYPHCKKIGLNLCVDKAHPKDKLDTHVLTHNIMYEVYHFAVELCGRKIKNMEAVLEHNFNICVQCQDGINCGLLYKLTGALKYRNPAWLSNAFVIQPCSHKQPGHVSKLKKATTMQKGEWMEAIKKRKLALQTKAETTTLPSRSISDVKSKTKHQSKGNYPICMEIGLDLDVTSKSAKKKKLNLKLLTRAVVMEIHKFAIQKVRHFYPRTVYDILDYNFNLSSQYYRRWEFLIATALEVKTMVKQYLKKRDKPDKIFKLPFVFDHRGLKRFAEKRGEKPTDSTLGIASKSELVSQSCNVPFLTSTDVSTCFPTVTPNMVPLFGVPPNKRGICEGEEQTEPPRNAPNKCDMEEEEMGIKYNYTCPLGESDLDADEVSDSGNSGNQDHLQNSAGSDIPREPESSCLLSFEPFITTTDISSTLPTVNSNVNPSFASQPAKKGLCGSEEQIQAPIYSPNECDIEQEGIGTEDNIWKLRANRVKQILSSQNKELGPFNWSKKAGLEFNVGFGPKQNIIVDSLNNHLLLELAKFARAMNSSQQYFIMEILEYNFDFDLQSQHHGNTFTREIMNGARQLSSCEDAVKYSNEVFELPGPVPSVNMASQSVGRVNPDLNSVLTMEKRDDAPICPPDSHSETKHALQKSEDLYPFCKEIGLKLHVNNSQPNKKLEINKLTNGAMTEVTNFAEKLCGTFEQICVDILRHNLDLDLQSGDSDLARSILAQMPALMEQKTPSTCVKGYKEIEGTIEDFSTMAKLDCQINPNVDACSAGPSQPPIIAQNVGSSSDTEYQNELNLKLWKLRANHIQQILSVPHLEHCPLYSYSRCKNLGIDFNVGAGVKQNLDPKLLTNGIMAEINAFVTALYSATKHFITEILEYNFNLNLKNELDRSAFAQKTMNSIHRCHAHKRGSFRRMKKPFELPDMRCIAEPTYDNTTHCPKCYQDRNDKLCQDESDLGHMHHPRPHTMTGTVSADENCTAQKPAKDPSSTFSTIEEEIMEGYPHCKKIGLNLCVDKAHPKDKLDTHVLTNNIMYEVYHFAVELCGRKMKNIEAVLEHNFNICVQCQDGIHSKFISQLIEALKYGQLDWLSNAFVIQPCSHKQPGHVSKLKKASTMQKGEWMEAIKKRKLALQTKVETATPPSRSISDVKSKAKHQSRENYPICMEIGLDLDVTSKSAKKKKLNLNLLTRAVVMEIRTFAIKKLKHSFPSTVYNILDYNFNISSQHHRRWEFSIATASKVNIMAKRYQKKTMVDGVFKLPFVKYPRTSQTHLKKRQNMKSANFLLEQSESSCLAFHAPLLASTNVSSSLPNWDSLFASRSDKRGLRGGGEQTQTPRNASNEFDIKEEEMEMENYTCPLGDSDLDADEISDSGNTGYRDHLQNPQWFSLSSDIPRELESSYRGICAPFLTHTDVSSTLTTVNSNVNPPFASHPHKRGLCGGEEQTQTPKNAPKKYDMEQEEIGTEDNMWKLRANRKKQILSEDFSTMVKIDCQNNPNVDACSSGPSQAPIIAQNVGSPSDTEYQNELNLKLWKLRANHIQQILSVPHLEHCPLYSYSRCKNLGIDFNVGAGVKQNLDPKLLTNGIMAEINTFVTALQSATKHFITEILEYNFNLNLKNELDRSAFAQKTLIRILALRAHKKCSGHLMKLPFELPDMRCIEEPTYTKMTYCTKCYHKLGQDESDLGQMRHPRPHTMTDTVSADANCTAQKPAKDPSSTFSTIEEEIMEGYPHCKKIGLNLCVDKAHPKDKLDTHVLTRNIMYEVFHFATELCGIKSKNVEAVLEHNFNICVQCQDGIHSQMLHKVTTALNDGELTWLSDVFVIQPCSHKQPARVSKLKEASTTQRSEWEETIKKRKLALQTKEATATLPSCSISDVKSKTKQIRGNYPICMEIGLDLDVTSNSGEKDKLDLKLLTRPVVMEIHTFATQEVRHDYPRTVYDILDYNFDLSSQHHRRLEFTKATASEVQAMVKQYHKKQDRPDKVFKLPFVFARKSSVGIVEKRQNKKRKKYSWEEPDEKLCKASFVRLVRCQSVVNHVKFLHGVKANEERRYLNEDTMPPTDFGTIVQMNKSLVSKGCQSPLLGNKQIKEEEYDLHYGDMNPEPENDEK